MDKNQIKSELEKVSEILSEVQLHYEEYSKDADEEITDAMDSIESAKELL